MSSITFLRFNIVKCGEEIWYQKHLLCCHLPSFEFLNNIRIISVETESREQSLNSVQLALMPFEKCINTFCFSFVLNNKVDWALLY